MNGFRRGGALDDRMQRYWAGKGGWMGRSLLTAVTAPASALFGLGVRLRNRAFDSGLIRIQGVPVPVVSVGNLSVGGTGKTPVVRWLVEVLEGRGYRPGIVSRGYGEDELALHRRWFPDLPVVARADRVEAAREAIAQGADVLVLDDGFQHRYLARDADLVLVGAADPWPPRLLPRGPYREPASALDRASLVLVTARGEADVEPGLARMADLRRHPRYPPLGILPLRPGEWQTLAGQPHPEGPPRGPLLVVASVARPGSVVDLVREALGQTLPPEGVELLAFPDHHPHDAEDVQRILGVAAGRSVVTTEKDAVKLAPFPELAEASVHVLGLKVAPDPGVDRLLRRLLDRILARGGRPLS